MKILEKIHRSNQEINFEKIWEEGLFVFDSNVLLDLYRLPVSTRNDLLNVFSHSKFNNRIWIPFQVYIEFLNDRFDAIGDQKNKFTEVKKLVEIAIEKQETNISELKDNLKKLNLERRHSLIDPDKYINEQNFENSLKFLNDFILHLDELSKDQFDVNEEDELKNKVIQVFKDKIGAPLNDDALKKIYADGKKRYEIEFPPGYKDAKKPGSHFYKNLEFVRKYGDLILWKEIIEKCKKEKIKYLVLVTGDLKEDWWHIKRGKRLGARIELLNEIYTSAEQLETFYLYDTSSFLKYAKSKINNRIKNSSIEDTQELIKQSDNKRKTDLAKVIFNYINKNLNNDLTKINSQLEKHRSEYEKAKTDLENLSKHRDNLYEQARKIGNNDTQYEHNLGIAEAEQEEYLDEIKDKINKLELEKRNIESNYNKFNSED